MITLSHAHKYLLGIIMLGSAVTLHGSQDNPEKVEKKESAAYLVRLAIQKLTDDQREQLKARYLVEKHRKYPFYDYIKPCYEEANLAKLPWTRCSLHPTLSWSFGIYQFETEKMPAIMIYFDTTKSTGNEGILVDYGRKSGANFTTTLEGARSGAQLLPSSSYDASYLYPSGKVSATEPSAGHWTHILLQCNSVAFIGHKERTYYVRRIAKGKKPVVYGLEIDSRVPQNDKEGARGGRIAIFPRDPQIGLYFKVSCNPLSMLFDDQVQKPAQDSAWFTTATMSLKLEPKEQKSK